MSYLLETLKRLEQERRQEGESDLLKDQGKVAKPRKRTLLWPYFLIAALLLNAGIVSWWLLPGQRSLPGISAPSPKAQVIRPGQAAPAAIPGAGDAPATGVRSGTGKVQAPVQGKPVRPGIEQGGRDTGLAGRQEAVQKATRIPPDTRTLSASPKPAGAAPVPERVETAAPDAANGDKNRMPPLKISLHSYGPARDSRLVRIGDRTLREGETLSSGVKVEEITPDGVILSREGNRFHLGINEER